MTADRREYKYYILRNPGCYDARLFIARRFGEYTYVYSVMFWRTRVLSV